MLEPHPRRPAALEIRPFDPFTATPEEWRQLHAYRHARQQEDGGGDPVVPDAEFEHEQRQQRPLYENRRFMAVLDGRFVGSLLLAFRRPGSPGCEEFAGFVDVWGGVLRAQRRQGIGTALLGTLHGFMQAHGQLTATLKVHVPDGHAFLAGIGAEAKFRSVENRLPLEVLDRDELARWEARAGHGDGLAWEHHAGRVPMERLATLMQPFTELINQQPLGTLEIPRIRYELAGYTTWYEDMDRRGGEHFLVLLNHGEEVVAMCHASWDARFPDRVYQQLTAVAAAWRGRGLAKAVKARMLRLLRERHPEARVAITTNAEANAPMLSINQRLGFVRHREDASYQIGREALARFAAPA